MEQRPLRLGDIVDDYCPRERRITDHAVVAMIDDAIKQTRCTACDAEHPYKEGKAPRRKKAVATGRLYKEVLAGIKEADAPQMAAADADHDGPVENVTPVDDYSVEDEVVELAAASPEPASAVIDDTPEDVDVSAIPVVDEGPVHRPLIRATLPRPDGMKVERPIPEFTIRHNGNGRPHGNGNSFRDARGGGGGKPRGSGQQRFNRGPGGSRPGRGGFGGGGRSGNGGGGSRRRGR